MNFDDKLYHFLDQAFQKLHIPCEPAQLKTLIQFVKFGIVGLSNTVIAYILNVLVLLALRGANVSWDYVAGNLVAFFLSVLWSFYWNNKYVFTLEAGQKRSLGKALLKTYLAYASTGIVLSNVLSYVWIEQLHFSKYVAPIMNLIITVPLNFLINKKWAFNLSP